MISGAAAAASALARSTTGPLAGPVPGREIAAASPSRPDTADQGRRARSAAVAQGARQRSTAMQNRSGTAIASRSSTSRRRLRNPAFISSTLKAAGRHACSSPMAAGPIHTTPAMLERFSNASGSNASSEGAFVTGDYYVGKHGRSQRLAGLDPTNDNAMERAIVIHGAWYANEDMIAAHGKLGRSQGCFAVGETCLKADVRPSRHGPLLLRGPRVGSFAEEKLRIAHTDRNAARDPGLSVSAH